MSFLFLTMLALFLLACITGDLLFWALFIVILLLWLISELIVSNTSERKPPRRRY